MRGSHLLRIEVEWLDSGLARSDGWESTDTIMNDMHISQNVLTSGFYLGEDDEKIVVALTHDPHTDMWFSAFAIAKENIKNVRILRIRGEQELGPDGRYFSKDE